MSKKLKTLLVLVLALILGILVSGLPKTKAQNQNNIDVEATWSVCPDGSGSIVRCATYNCPKGDTNGDGACTIADEQAKLTDLRNDPLCSNPPSGCGQVYYYNKSGSACANRIKDTQSCKISSASAPVFATEPTSTPTPTPTPQKQSSNEATNSTTTLPKTGPSIFTFVFLSAAAFVGIYFYKKFRFI